MRGLHCIQLVWVQSPEVTLCGCTRAINKPSLNNKNNCIPCESYCAGDSGVLCCLPCYTCDGNRQVLIPLVCRWIHGDQHYRTIQDIWIMACALFLTSLIRVNRSIKWTGFCLTLTMMFYPFVLFLQHCNCNCKCNHFLMSDFNISSSYRIQKTLFIPFGKLFTLCIVFYNIIDI